MNQPLAFRRVSALAAIAALCAAALAYCFTSLAPAARADGPGTGAPWTVSLGDSYISGEAGRWAGNTNGSSSNIDALGSTAYYDNEAGNGESISGCHRSKAAEVFIGNGVNGKNLACSGAKTSTFTEGSTFKPGIDFYNSGGKEGQALMLQHFAAAHNVKLVAVSIGGNNFNFASIVQTCVEDWLLTPEWWPAESRGQRYARHRVLGGSTRQSPGRRTQSSCGWSLNSTLSCPWTTSIMSAWS